MAVRFFLARYLYGLPPFTPSYLFRKVPPCSNETLLVKIDLERALEAGCRSAEEIVEFLCCDKEGWFVPWAVL
jgi:hypothetical protein